MFLGDFPVNAWGVFVAAVVYFMIGAIWYAPFLFGNERRKHEEKPEEEKGCCPSHKIVSYVGEFIISLVIAYVLALFIQISQADDIMEGMAVALWVWIGFIATTHFSAVLWDRKTVKHFFIHASFMLVGFIAMGAVLIYFL